LKQSTDGFLLFLRPFNPIVRPAVQANPAPTVCSDVTASVRCLTSKELAIENRLPPAIPPGLPATAFPIIVPAVPATAPRGTYL